MPAEPYCVQATTLDRALVLSETYEEGKTYVVREPLTLGVRIPEESGLPDRSFGERLSEERGLFVSVLASLLFGLPMAAALLLASSLPSAIFTAPTSVSRRYKLQ
jgi:hypothetical protein